MIKRIWRWVCTQEEGLALLVVLVLIMIFGIVMLIAVPR